MLMSSSRPARCMRLQLMLLELEEESIGRLDFRLNPTRPSKTEGRCNPLGIKCKMSLCWEMLLALLVIIQVNVRAADMALDIAVLVLLPSHCIYHVVLARMIATPLNHLPPLGACQILTFSASCKSGCNRIQRDGLPWLVCYDHLMTILGAMTT